MIVCHAKQAAVGRDRDRGGWAAGQWDGATSISRRTEQPDGSIAAQGDDGAVCTSTPAGHFPASHAFDPAHEGERGHAEVPQEGSPCRT